MERVSPLLMNTKEDTYGYMVLFWGINDFGDYDGEYSDQKPEGRQCVYFVWFFIDCKLWRTIYDGRFRVGGDGGLG